MCRHSILYISCIIGFRESNLQFVIGFGSKLAFAKWHFAVLQFMSATSEVKEFVFDAAIVMGLRMVEMCKRCICRTKVNWFKYSRIQLQYKIYFLEIRVRLEFCGDK